MSNAGGNVLVEREDVMTRERREQCRSNMRGDEVQDRGARVVCLLWQRGGCHLWVQVQGRNRHSGSCDTSGCFYFLEEMGSRIITGA